MKQVFAWAVLSYLRALARLALFIHNPQVIGITGSVGKSSARDAIYAVLKDFVPTTSIEKGNSESGVPLGILGISMENYSTLAWAEAMVKAPFGINFLSHTKYLIIEMGVDDPYPPKNMGYHLTIAKPQIAVFLNTFAVHTMQFEKTLTDAERQALKNNPEKLTNTLISKIAHEKARIITESGCRVGIYNGDNTFVVEAIQKAKQNNSLLLSFGNDSSNSIYYGKYEVDLKGTLFTFYLNWENKKESILLKIQNYALPKEYQEIISSAVLIGKYAGLSNYQITSSLQKNFKLPAGRSTLLEGINDSVIIDSSYNASKASVLAFLELCLVLKAKTNRPFVFVFGDMRELGDEAEHEHEAIRKQLVGHVDSLICVGPLTRQYVFEPFQKENADVKIEWFPNANDAGEYLKKHMPDNSLVLVKGSQNTIFLEEAIKYVLKDQNDVRKLCRQNLYWMGVKEKAEKKT